MLPVGLEPAIAAIVEANSAIIVFATKTTVLLAAISAVALEETKLLKA